MALAEHIARLEEENKQLRARVAELERRLNRNSDSSNLLPSTDVFGRPQVEPKPRSSRARGKQKGPLGNGLVLVAVPDRTMDHRPAACGGCGEALIGLRSQSFARRQVFDIPLATVQVTGHRMHKVRCGGSRILGG